MEPRPGPTPRPATRPCSTGDRRWGHRFTLPRAPKKPGVKEAPAEAPGAGAGAGGGVVAGVRKAAAVTGYRLEGGQYQPEGKLGLAILGKEGAASYQLLLYRCPTPLHGSRGKQSGVAGAALGPALCLEGQPGTYLSFR